MPCLSTIIPDADLTAVLAAHNLPAGPLDLQALLRDVEDELARLSRPNRRVKALRHRVFWAITEAYPLPD